VGAFGYNLFVCVFLGWGGGGGGAGRVDGFHRAGFCHEHLALDL
jgi:hypothetical protein